MRPPKTVALWLALRGVTAPAERTAIRRKIGSKYAKRKPRKVKAP